MPALDSQSTRTSPVPARVRLIFERLWPAERPAWWAEALVLLFLAVALFIGVHLAFGVPEVVHGRGISLSPAVLPYYAMLSLARMTVAYVLSILFTLVYGYKAAYDRGAQRVLL